MKIQKIVGVLVMLLLILGCGTTNKKIASSINSEALDEMVLSKHFRIDIEWARPRATTSMNSVLSSGLRPPGSMVNRINLLGNGNFLEMEGDEVSADLPYFGERQMGGGFNSNTGIKFEGLPKDLEITKDEEKQRTMINFAITENMESYNVSITLTPKLSGSILITSSQRNSIWYEGKVSLLDTSEK